MSSAARRSPPSLTQLRTLAPPQAATTMPIGTFTDFFRSRAK